MAPDPFLPKDPAKRAAYLVKRIEAVKAAIAADPSNAVLEQDVAELTEQLREATREANAEGATTPRRRPARTE